MPRGRKPKQHKEEPAPDIIQEVPGDEVPEAQEVPEEQKESVLQDPSELRERPLSPEEERIKASRKSLEEKLGQDQKFFESPEGEIIIGPAEKDHVWSRTMNGGKGGWANPRR